MGKMSLLKPILLLCITFSLTQISCQNKLYRTGFEEPTDSAKFDLTEWENISPGLHSSFASSDKRYSYRSVPDVKECKKQVCTGWKGERINLEFLLWSSDYQENIRISPGSFSGSKNNIIDSNMIKIFWF